MNDKPMWRYMPPAGPLLSFLLIGLILLSGLLYYRSVNIQRYLEPALALSQPRNDFNKNIKFLFQKEFGANLNRDIKTKGSSILIGKSQLFFEDGILKASAKGDLRKLSRIFLSLMKDDHARSEISLVLIIARYPSYVGWADFVERMKVQRMVGFIQDAMFQEEPELEIRYAPYFAGVAQPTNPYGGTLDMVELRIIPSEYLHVEVLEKLEKYAH